MIIFRPNRRLLCEAMAEAREFADEADMFSFISENSHGQISVEDLYVMPDPVADDDRNGWHDTRYVCTNRLGAENYKAKYGHGVIEGFCATDYDRQKMIIDGPASVEFNGNLGDEEEEP